MKLTNLFGLPDPICQAIANDPYSAGDADFSVTTLLKPPRMVRLEKTHSDEIVVDCSERIFSLLGQAVHVILERSERTGAFAEKRFYAELDGVRISGGTDRLVYWEQILQDYKVCPVYKVLKEEYDDWALQQNFYRWLLDKNGYVASRLQIVAIFRDWTKRKARTEERYPVAQVQLIDLPVWGLDEIESKMRARIMAHRAAEKELPLCTDKDRWKDADTFALLKPGNKRATIIFQTEEEAKAYLQAHPGLEIIHRRGEARRCIDYCSASKFCGQFQGSDGSCT